MSCRRIGAALAVGVGATGLWIGSAPAQAPTAFLAGATAAGARFTYTVPAFLVLEEFVDAGGPIAQSQLATGDVSRAFASNPFPGATAVGAPGVVAFATGLPALPDYPLYVSADNPFKPEQTSQDPSGTYRLAAKAGPKESTAVAAAGPESSGTRGRTSITIAGDGALVSLAETVVHGINVGDGALQIASVTSRATTTLAPGTTKPKTKTDLVIDGARVMNTPVGFTAEGLKVAGSGVPVGAAEQLAPLNAALRDAGLKVEVIGADAVQGGAAADTLQITSVSKIPVPGTPTGTAIYRFGGATSFVSVGAAGAAQPIAPLLGASADGGSTAVTSSVGDAGLSASSVGAAPSGEAQAPSQTVATAPRPAITPTADVGPVALARHLGDTVRWFYVVLMVGGVLFIVGASLWRSKGVQVPWTASSTG